tara:strand:- start:9952 stop:10332 length:381 start_codon:yes stop_codon:yes gene_type:complete
VLNFDTHSVFIKPSFGYCIIRIKKNSFLDRETVASIISINETFIELGFFRFMVDIQKGVTSNTKAIDHLSINGNQSKLERIAFVDANINNIQIFLLNLLIKCLYLKGKVEIKLFKTKKQAGKWLKE